MPRFCRGLGGNGRGIGCDRSSFFVRPRDNVVLFVLLLLVVVVVEDITVVMEETCDSVLPRFERASLRFGSNTGTGLIPVATLGAVIEDVSMSWVRTDPVVTLLLPKPLGRYTHVGIRSLASSSE